MRMVWTGAGPAASRLPSTLPFGELPGPEEAECCQAQSPTPIASSGHTAVWTQLILRNCSGLAQNS
jgi:hypothetical protein